MSRGEWGTAAFMSSTSPPSLEVEFPDDVARDQDHEWCRVTMNGTTRKIRFHDYHEIYSVPGLYEYLFYEHLECCSPQVVCGLLEDALSDADVDASTLRVLDLGAGNGMVGQELADLGADMIAGVDLLPEAAAAAERDRPGVYDDYLVLDLTELSGGLRRELRERRFNALVSVAALGFGDIPPRAFAEAFNLVEDGGWIAFNIKEDFLGDGEPTGFSRLIGSILESGIVEQRAEKVYRHRLSANGDALDYVALVGVKSAPIPDELVRDIERTH
jgi:SAM-dependent methyltransferase